MNAKEREEYWYKFHRFQMRQELLYTPKINKVLKEQIQTYIKHRDIIYVRSGGMYEVLTKLYLSVGPAWAWSTRSLIKKDGGQMGFSERIVQFMRQLFMDELLADAENITQTTIRLIQDVLSEGALKGWSFDDIVDKLISPDMTANRARLIARTETVGAANGGSMVNAAVTGIPLNKIWISARDSRTRLHHQEVDNTIVPKDSPFNVGASLMQYPGDKAGSAAEVCNCRCAIAFIPVEEKAIEPEPPVDYAPYFEKTQNNISVLKKSLNETTADITAANTHQVNVFTEILKQAIGEIPAPVVNVEAPIVNIPEPVVNVEAPIVQVTEQKVDQSEVVNLINVGVAGVIQIGKDIVKGQQEIIRLQNEMLKPKPKKVWQFDTVLEGGRIKKVIAKEI